MVEEQQEYCAPDGTIQTSTGDDEEAAGKYAYRLFQALGDCIEALLRISAAEGPDRSDALDRACACIRHNQEIAHTVLAKYGFRPRARLIDE